jgi:predicted nucleic acid-binding protein
MAWVVDTCVLLDIGLDDPRFGRASESLLLAKATEGLVVCPVTFIELAPAFHGNLASLRKFLIGLSVDFEETWSEMDSEHAARAWARHIARRRQRPSSHPKRPVADLLIGAFAMRFDGLVTRNTTDFRNLFPKLPLARPD